MIKKMYYWKDKQGNVKQAEGFELEDYEKAALCKENLARVKKQQESGEYGATHTTERGISSMVECKVLELPKKRTKK